MLHQFGARSDQDERSNLVIDFALTLSRGDGLGTARPHRYPTACCRPGRLPGGIESKRCFGSPGRNARRPYHRQSTSASFLEAFGRRPPCTSPRLTWAVIRNRRRKSTIEGNRSSFHGGNGFVLSVLAILRPRRTLIGRCAANTAATRLLPRLLRRFRCLVPAATCQSGYGAVCKTVYPGSIPGVASTQRSDIIELFWIDRL
jgi:hypothetical protein